MTQDLIVIGGGAGGLNVASGAAQLGLKVTLIEKNATLGGDCLHYGCVPSKTFIHAAKTAHIIKNSAKFGLKAHLEPISLWQVNSKVKQVVEQIQAYDDPKRFESYGCQVIFGAARFIAENTVQVGDKILSAKRIVIACGSKPIIPDIPGLSSINYLTNESVFDLQNLPSKIVVLGGGPIGIELAQGFARFGARVTIIERGAHILKMLDRDVLDVVMSKFQQEGIECVVNTDIQTIREDNGVKSVHCYSADKGEFIITTDAILVATGRQANIEALNLAAANVKYTHHGIVVNARLKTSNSKIFAIGDAVDSPYKFTHLAEYHAGVVITNIAFKFPKKTDLSLLPWVIYTDPEIAQVGLTEKEAVEQKIKHKVLRFDYKDIDRALAQHEPEGFVKLLVAKNRIIGASLVGPQSGELLAEVTLAMQGKLKLSVISKTIHSYPTLSQVIRRAVNTYYAPKLFSKKVKAIVKLLNFFS